MTSRFEITQAVRSKVPLLVGLMGPTGCGKTYSALRLATGMKSVSGGDIVVIDTESRRALHYANDFEFKHMPFEAPFSPLDYLEAIKAAVDAGAGVVIVDSASHEWEGPGGVLEMHDEKAKELAKAWNTKIDKVKLTAWAEPKSKHRRLVNSLLQLPVHFIFCFRAKEKIKVRTGKEPEQLGFMPIAADDMVYEFGVNCLLYPGANGVPTWEAAPSGERQMIKLPGWAKSMFPKGRPLDEEQGAALARWAEGVQTRSVEDVLNDYIECTAAETLASLEDERRLLWGTASDIEKRDLKAASDQAKKRVEQPPAESA